MSECQHVLVWDAQTRQVGIDDRQYIVAELPWCLDRGSRKILIREEEGQLLGGF